MVDFELLCQNGGWFCPNCMKFCAIKKTCVGVLCAVCHKPAKWCKPVEGAEGKLKKPLKTDPKNCHV